MKKNHEITLIAILASIFVSCQKPPQPPAVNLPWLSNFDEAFVLAKKTNRPVIAEFSTEWCQYCKFIEETIFEKPDVSRKLADFVLLKIDGDRKEAQALMDKYEVNGFPTFVILDHNGREKTRFSGVSSTAEFLDILDNIQSDKPGRKELERAVMLDDDGKGKEAKKFAEAAYAKLNAAGDPKTELALALLKKFSKGDRPAVVKYVSELLNKFPDSVYVPNYYKALADEFGSSAIKNSYLDKVARIIEERIADADNLNEEFLRILIDEHIDLLAKIYGEMKMPALIGKTYKKGAGLGEWYVKNSGGIENNTHMVGLVGYYYTNAGNISGAEKFLKRAMEKLPDYWPVYSNYAKVLIEKGRPAEAIAYAKKAYDIAEEVAKPRAALIEADAYVSLKDVGKAIEVLKNAEADLLKTGGAEKGRAGWMKDQLADRIKEYKEWEAMNGKK